VKVSKARLPVGWDGGVVLALLEATELFVGGIFVLSAASDVAVFGVVLVVLLAARVDEQTPMTINVTGKPPSNRRDLKRFIG
jgi:hypothetical protein